MSKLSAETKAHMAEARKQWWASRTEEEKQAYAEKQRKPHPKTSEAMKGRKPSSQAIEASKRARASNLDGQKYLCENPGCANKVYRFPYEIQAGTHRFCSGKCYIRWRRLQWKEKGEKSRSIYTCSVCGKEFQRLTSREQYGEAKYCSRKCAEKGRVGRNSTRWDGGIHRRKDGYIDVSQSLVPDKFKSMIRQSQQKVLQHRLVMAQHLDRPLKTHEVVHHKDGDRSNNRIDNLEMHSAYAHDGITADTNKKSATMKREIGRLESKATELEDTIVSLRAEIDALQAKLKRLEG